LVAAVAAGEIALEADGLAPAQAGVPDREDHGEVLIAAGQQRGALGEQKSLQW
jgi:hypothetical protein